MRKMENRLFIGCLLLLLFLTVFLLLFVMYFIGREALPTCLLYTSDAADD